MSSSEIVDQRAWRRAADDVERDARLGFQALEEAEQGGGLGDLVAVDALDDVAVAEAELREEAVVADLEEAKARRVSVAHLGDGAQLGHETAQAFRAHDFATVDDPGVLAGMSDALFRGGPYRGRGWRLGACRVGG